MTRAAVVTAAVALEGQREKGIGGDMMEIGAWHGRSAALWMAYLESRETLHVLDLEVRPPLEKNLNRFAKESDGDFNLQKQNSFTLARDGFSELHRESLRLIHVDGDHTAAGISNDLRACTPMLHPFGVLVVDDFMNARFPQITEVVFDYVGKHTHDYAVVFAGANKGLLVKTKVYEFWYQVLSESLSPALDANGVKYEQFEGTIQNRACICIR